MPTVQSITTTYAGEHAGKYIAASLLGSDTLRTGSVEVMPNIKFKEVISRLDVATGQVDSTCDFTPGGTVTLTERIIEPKELQINLEICKKNYRNTWEAEQMGFSAFDRLAPNFQQFLLARIAAQAANANELNIWQGDTTVSGEYDGFETRLAAEALLPAANEVAGTTLSAANIIAEIGKVLDAVPSAVYMKDDFSIYMGTAAYRFYVRAQAALGAFDAFSERRANKTYEGTQILVCPGMSDNVMVAARKSDLIFGTGLLNDHNLVKLIDMEDIDGSQNVRFIMRFTAGTQIGNPEDVVTYGITNSAN